MFRRFGLLVSCLMVLLSSQSANATFIGDTIDAHYENIFGTVFDNTATVGNGEEFTGISLFYTYELDFTDTSFTLTISKPFSSGNFTGIFESLSITNIDNTILGVSFDAANSSAFSSGTPDIDFSNPGSILLSTNLFLSANTPASALSHSFTWNVEFDSVEVSNPPMIVLFALGLLLMLFPVLRQLPKQKKNHRINTTTLSETRLSLVSSSK